MSDTRRRDLERKALTGDHASRVALRAARCRAGEHAWSCKDTTGAVVTYIWCVGCLERRPKDEHERAVEAWVARLADQARGAYGRAVRRNGSAAEFERLQAEIGHLSGALFDYRQAIAPHMLLVMPVLCLPATAPVSSPGQPQGVNLDP